LKGDIPLENMVFIGGISKLAQGFGYEVFKPLSERV
jgi:hypothetical protein